MDLYELIKQGNVKHVQHFFQINPDYLLNSSKVCEEILTYSIKTAPPDNLIRLISILLQFGANPNPNNEANAPLLSAIEIPDISVIQLLVNSGANVNFTNEKGQSVLHIFLKSKKTENGLANILKLFLERGANLDAADPSGTTVRKLIENSLEDMNDQEKDEVRRILEQYPVGHFKKSFQKVESWLSKSIDEFEDQESSVSSIQSVNEDMRILRDENIKLRNELKNREIEIERLKLENSKLETRVVSKNRKNEKSPKRSFISLKI